MIQKKIFFTNEPGMINAAYVYLQDADKTNNLIQDRESYGQIRIDKDGVEIEGVAEFAGELILDLDDKGKIVGIEILGDLIPDELKR